MPKNHIKDPDATLDFGIDWSVGEDGEPGWLDGDTIIGSVWIVPDGLVSSSEAHSTTQTVVWLSGGARDATYTVTNRITTAAGRVDDRSLSVTIEDR